jgi:hypothetical protein
MSRAFNLSLRVTAAALLAGMAGIFTSVTHAQKNGGVIYTCTDAAGRQITADRPIDSCMDRPQRVMSSQGWLIKIIPPESTPAQRAERQAQERQAQAALQRQRDQERGDQALLIRYPTQAEHEAGRRAALAQTQSLLAQARQQLATLKAEHTRLTHQMTASGGASDPATTPAQIERDLADDNQIIEEQQQLTTGYQAEIDRINARFNAEDKRLEPLWHEQNPPAAATAAVRTP